MNGHNWNWMRRITGIKGFGTHFSTNCINSSNSMTQLTSQLETKIAPIRIATTIYSIKVNIVLCRRPLYLVLVTFLRYIVPTTFVKERKGGRCTAPCYLFAVNILNSIQNPKFWKLFLCH